MGEFAISPVAATDKTICTKAKCKRGKQLQSSLTLRVSVGFALLSKAPLAATQGANKSRIARILAKTSPTRLTRSGPVKYSQIIVARRALFDCDPCLIRSRTSAMRQAQLARALTD